MKIKSFISGFLVAAFLFVGLSVFADTAFVKQITANVGGVDIVLDGTKLVPKDANGKLVPPIAFDGTTYVPIRYLTAALGKNLTRVGDIIYFGDVAKVTATYLSELTPALKSDNWNTFGLMGGWVSNANPLNKLYSYITYSKGGKMTMMGKQYTSVSTIQADGLKETWGYYNIDGKYSKISGYFGIDDISTDNGLTRGTLEIYADSNLLKSVHMSRGQEPYLVEADLKGVKTLKVLVKGTSTVNNFNGDYYPISQTVCNFFDIRLHY